MSQNSYVTLDAAGFDPDELAECVAARVKPVDADPLTPVAIQIEGGSDFKGLLTEGIDPEEG